MSCQPNPRRPDHVRKAGWFLVFCCASVVLMAASAPECARTEDNPLSSNTALSPTAGGAGECLQACAQQASELRLAERSRFKGAMEACQDEDCRQEEAALHVSILIEITSSERECMSACHNQGGGSGGQ